MTSRIKTIFTAPTFPGKPEQAHQARIIHSVIVFVAGFLAVAILLVVTLGYFSMGLPLAQVTQALLALVVAELALLVAGLQLRRGRLPAAGMIVAFAAGGAVILVTIRGGGVTRPAFFTEVFALVVAALVFRHRAAVFIAMGLLLAASIGIYAYSVRVVPDIDPTPPLNFLIVNAFILGSVAVLMDFSTRNLYAALYRSLANEKDLEQKNYMLYSMTRDLEKMVDDRTSELRRASDQLEKRASQFAAIADVARSIATLQDLDVLLPEIATVVSSRFGFYQTGILLLD